MAKVKVLTTYNPGWNIGDTVELEGEELKKQLEAQNVELVEGEKVEEPKQEEPEEKEERSTVGAVEESKEKPQEAAQLSFHQKKGKHK